MSDQLQGPTRQPLRVLQLAKYFDPDKGGVETVTHDISEGLLLHNVDADVLCFSRQPSYPSYDGPFKVVRAKTDLRIADKSLSLDYVRKMSVLVQDYDVGLLHLPNPVGMLGALCFWHKPLVLIWHADIVTYPRAGRLFRPLERWLIAKSSIIISPTPAHSGGSYLAQKMAAKKVIAPYPFSPNKLAGAPADDPALSGLPEQVSRFLAGRKLILAVGRLVPYKGFDVLIAAARALDANAAVCIVGVGPLEQDLCTKIAECGVEDQVILAGGMSDAELKALYQLAHVVTMPSVTRAEMYGMTQVEAMSFGKPVVSTAIADSGVSWVNQDGISGTIVPVGDADALANALNALCTDERLYERRARGAQDLFASTHSLSAAAGRYAEILRAAAAGSASAYIQSVTGHRE